MIKIGLSLFALTIGWLSIATASNYAGSLGIYLLFTVTANALLFNGFHRSSLYFDTFIGIFFWLGFWLKLSVRVAFMEGVFHEPIGDFDGSGVAYDHALLVCSCAFIALLLASHIRKWIFRYPTISPSVGQPALFQLYCKYRIVLLIAFIVIVAGIAASNIWLGIYQRGMVTQTVLPIGLNGVYKWLLQFGLASFAALVIRFEIERSKRLTWAAIFVPLIEGFLSNVSLLSRGMVLNATALGLGGWKTLLGPQYRAEWIRIIGAIFVFAIIFASSVVAVNFFRAEFMQKYQSEEYNRAIELSDLQNLDSESAEVVRIMTTPLFIDRWVGIEGVLAVSSSDQLGWNVWSAAWKEKYREDQLTLYDRVFTKTPYYIYVTKDKHHFISLPGIVAFLYYPGSLGFLLAALVLCGLFAAGAEILCYRYCGQNWILCSLFAQVIAFRFASFGYVPAQSYLLFGALLLNGALFFFAECICAKLLGGRLVTASSKASVKAGKRGS